MTNLNETQRAAILSAAEELEGIDESVRRGQRAHWGTYGESRRDLDSVDSDLLDLAERVSALATAIADAFRKR
ncbi:hypothetical protein [Kineosporia succinea]|uniref:Type VII secretion system (Wss) protein ESAT-6 n=1 Tax=Kineosporia succinea TaxID=84632 RepID=A0ABT9P9N7_9ACTN|nr:hypothetical protein [Kineosporia succinea]MDP9829398.1 hypothetical protein [Kineosporia succinea]